MSIHEAAERGDIKGVARALGLGTSVDKREQEHGYTPLMVAAASPTAGLVMVRFLVEQGADVNARSWTPETAAEAGARSHSPDYAQYQFTGDTALTLAAATGDLEVVRFLLDAGADVNATNTHGYGAVIKAISSKAPLSDGNAELVALLLERGAEPDRATVYRETALKTAAGFGMFDILALLLAAGADPAPLGWNALHSAVVFGSLADVRAQLAAGAELEAYDAFGRTALHLSLQVGDVDKAQVLRAAGAELAPGGYDWRSPLHYVITPSHPAALAWLLAQGCDPDAVSGYGRTPLMEAVAVGATDAVRLLLDAGARVDRKDEYDNEIIGEANNLEIVQLLLAHGGDLNGVSDPMRLALFGIAVDDALDLPRAVYLAGKARRFGANNPEVMDVPFWHAMVRSRVSAYAARSRFGDTDACGDTPVWCFQRFGRTLTALPDGRYVEIAGEHEDFYDPDFCIYNDVVVYQGDGTFTLYGYPEMVFPPTDFHSATLVDDYIYLIGSVGYQGQRRFGETPVYRLSRQTWQIERVETRGKPPGWISRHSAVYDAEHHQIVVSGGKRGELQSDGSADDDALYREILIDTTGVYALELATMTWRQLSG